MLSRPGEMTELLREAFPRDTSNATVCRGCEKPRNRVHALCARCWRDRLTADQRRDYRRTEGLAERAALLIEWIR